MCILIKRLLWNIRMVPISNVVLRIYKHRFCFFKMRIEGMNREFWNFVHNFNYYLKIFFFQKFICHHKTVERKYFLPKWIFAVWKPATFESVWMNWFKNYYYSGNFSDIGIFCLNSSLANNQFFFQSSRIFTPFSVVFLDFIFFSLNL